MKIKINEKEFSFDAPISAYDALKEAELITREVIAARVSGKVVDLTHVLADGDTVEILTFADSDGKHVFFHTASHILAMAVKRLYPNTKLTIGPAIDDGFYYDFDSDTPFTTDMLKDIEGEMKKIVKENLKLERFTLPRDEAKKLMAERGEMMIPVLGGHKENFLFI
jgi:threonyl-tRNA synthetase